MKYIITLSLIFIINASFGQQISYSDWKNAAKTEIRLLPKFGNAPKTKEQKEADQDLIKTYLVQQGTHRKASDLLVKLGFDYLYKMDMKTAMFRFNQAWLLDPKNENVYWGFGAIYFTFQDFQNALKQYDEGLILNPKSSNILTDKATIHMTRYSTGGNENDYLMAIKLFKQSYTVDPKNQNTLFKLSACYFYKNDCANAWKYYDECKKLGGQPITQEYTEALIKACKR